MTSWRATVLAGAVVGLACGITDLYGTPEQFLPRRHEGRNKNTVKAMLGAGEHIFFFFVTLSLTFVPSW